MRRPTRPLAIIAAAAAAALVLTSCQSASGEEYTAVPGDSRAPTGAEGSLADLVPSSIRAVGTLDAGVTAESPALVVAAGDGEFRGASVDLMLEYAHRLDLDIELRAVDGHAQELLTGGEIDLAPAVVESAQMHEELSVVSYAHAGAVLVEASDAPTGVTGVDDLCGLGVIAPVDPADRLALSDASSACEAAGKDPIRLVPSTMFDTAAQLDDLASGEAEIIWMPIAEAAVALPERADDFSVVADVAPWSYWGVALSREHAELGEAIQAALESMIEDGTYAEILERWNLSPAAVEAPGINASEFSTSDFA